MGTLAGLNRAGAAASLFAMTMLLTSGAPAQQQAQSGQYQPATEARYPKLSPGAAYDAVSQPVVLTRAAVSNWSETELAALADATSEARLECATRSPEMFHGSDLIALGRLCALGQQWSTVGNVETLYINSKDEQKPELSAAYALGVEAALQMHEPMTALHECEAMLKAAAYSQTVDAATNETLHYLQLVYMDDALALYAEREPYVLAGLRAKTTTAGSGAPVGSATASVGVGASALYGDGLAYAALEQLAGHTAGAAATVHDLDAALAEGAPTPDDQVQIAAARDQYAMLGRPLPPIAATLSLYDVTETPRINTEYGASTVLLLFPRWCAQCVRMAEGLLPVLVHLSEQNVHIYALLAEAAPTVVVPAAPEQRHGGRSWPTAPAEKKAAADDAPKTIEQRLRRTPTLVVPEATVGSFHAEGFPFLIATDSKGIIRFMQPAPENALIEGSFVDQVTAQIIRQWPPAAKAAATGTTQP